MSEESFIIRLYRRRIPPPAQCAGLRRAQLSGIVEIVSRGERRPFHNAEQLWAILAGPHRKRRRARHDRV